MSVKTQKNHIPHFNLFQIPIITQNINKQKQKHFKQNEKKIIFHIVKLRKEDKNLKYTEVKK